MGDQENLELVYSLAGFPDETEWIEFKEGNSDPVRIAQDISALANSAAYLDREYAYKVWGLEDATHALVGTAFNPLQKKARGNQPLLLWLRSMLSNNASYDFEQFDHDGKHFVVLKVRRASGQPVTFDHSAYIREGNATTAVSTGSAKEAELWRRLQREGFELREALGDLTATEVADSLDLDAYYNLLGLRKPHDLEGVLRPLSEQGLLNPQDNGRYSITNLGALLVARRLTAFPGLRKRVLRVVRHDGRGNFRILEDRHFDCGYALALPVARDYIVSAIPAEEVLEGAFRKVRHAFPPEAIRELLSNTVMHQDLSDATAGPLVGIYENRIEFSNPGAPLVPVNRLLNARPKTRNALLVDVMRQMDLCEEDGTGWDIAVDACERVHAPAPEVESDEILGTKVTLFEGRSYDRMTKQERRNAVYWHACLMYAQGESMSNQTLRDRFGLPAERKNVIAMSRLIRECIDCGLVHEEDEESSDRFRRYVPAWA